MSPFFLDDRFFAPASRAVLLTVIVLTQMFTQAVLFDFRFGDIGQMATCANTVTSTTTTTMDNVTVQMNETDEARRNASDGAKTPHSAANLEF